MTDANICIYCEKVEDNLTKEHVIPLSFGGDFTIGRASCKACADATSKIEFSIARNSYHLPRAVSGMRSRRRKRFPTHVSMEIFFGKYGPKKEIDVTIDQAVIEYIVPVFEQVVSSGKLESRQILTVCSFPEDEEAIKLRVRRIAQLHRAYSTRRWSAAMNPVDFAALIWKISVGFLFLASPNSLRASKACDRARKFGDTINSGTSEGKIWSFYDIKSIERSLFDMGTDWAWVYTCESEEHRNIWCAINILPNFSLPIYVTRIDNVEGDPIDRRF